MLEKALTDGFERLKVGGRMSVITFHSLEDRIVKTRFKEFCTGCTCPPEFPVCVCGKQPRGALVGKKPITASEEELTQRLTQRGSSHLIERSLFLKDKLERAAEHAPYLYHVGGKTVEQELSGLDMSRYEVFLS